MKPNDERRPREVDEQLLDHLLFGSGPSYRDEEFAGQDGDDRAAYEALAGLVLAEGAMRSAHFAAPMKAGWENRLFQAFDQAKLVQVGSRLPSNDRSVSAVDTAAQPGKGIAVGERTNAEQATSQVAPSAQPPESQSRTPLWMSVAAAFGVGVSLGLLLGLSAWQGRAESKGQVAQAPSLEQRYRALLTDGETRRVDWQGNNQGDIAGFVVWNDRLQSGFMGFETLAPNDPKIEQYQLWIFDTARSDDHPVDGGVFDINVNSANRIDGVTLVEVDAKLPVSHAKMFAVTVEPPGGSVVSSREKLPGLAVVPQ